MISTTKIEKEFRRIKALEFIKSNRIGNTGIGKTFEDHLGVIENNLKDSDFDGFEVKSQRFLAGSPITLFTKQFTYPSGANKILTSTYGNADATYKKFKVLHASMFSSRNSLVYGKYNFTMKLDRRARKLFLEIRDLNSNLLNRDCYYTYDDLKAIKLNNTFIVWANRRKIDGHEHFHFTHAKVFFNFSFERLLDAIDNGALQFDIRVGIFRTGALIGKQHDHGNGFRLMKDAIPHVFENVLDLE